MHQLRAAIVLAILAAACGGVAVEDESDDAVVVDTSTPAARAQYDADVEFAAGYTARCAGPVSGRPRVIVTGFGRFLDVQENATGLMVSALVPAAVYPRTQLAPGRVD